NFSKILPFPDILVVLDAKPEIIYQRRTKRNRKNDVFDFETILEESKNTEFEEMLSRITKDSMFCGKEITVIRLDNNDDHEITKHVQKISSIISSQIN